MQSKMAATAWLIALCFTISSAKAGSPFGLTAQADWGVNDYNNPDNDNNSNQSAGPSTATQITASVISPDGNAQSTARAKFDSLGAQASITPNLSLADYQLYASSVSHVYDQVTISGSNNGTVAFATFKLHVSGQLRQPEYVDPLNPDFTAITNANARLQIYSVSASISGQDGVNYNLSEGGPLIESFSDVLEVKLPFIVGSSLTYFAEIQSSAVTDHYIGSPGLAFESLFNQTATLSPIHLSGVTGPITITSAIGAQYLYSVPEPTTIGMLGGLVLAMSRRRR